MYPAPREFEFNHELNAFGLKFTINECVVILEDGYYQRDWDPETSDDPSASYGDLIPLTIGPDPRSS